MDSLINIASQIADTAAHPDTLSTFVQAANTITGFIFNAILVVLIGSLSE